MQNSNELMKLQLNYLAYADLIIPVLYKQSLFLFNQVLFYLNVK